jgi:hypothetical protein
MIHMKTPDEEKFYEGLTKVVASGTEADARNYIRDNFKLLSEESRTDLMMNMFAELADREVRERDTITQIQEQGIAALEALDKIEKEGK